MRLLCGKVKKWLDVYNNGFVIITMVWCCCLYCGKPNVMNSVTIFGDDFLTHLSVSHGASRLHWWSALGKAPHLYWGVMLLFWQLGLGKTSTQIGCMGLINNVHNNGSRTSMELMLGGGPFLSLLNNFEWCVVLHLTCKHMFLWNIVSNYCFFFFFAMTW